MPKILILSYDKLILSSFTFYTLETYICIASLGKLLCTAGSVQWLAFECQLLLESFVLYAKCSLKKQFECLICFLPGKARQVPLTKCEKVAQTMC